MLEDQSVMGDLQTYMWKIMIEKLRGKTKLEKNKNSTDKEKIIHNVILEYLINKKYAYTEGMLRQEVDFFQKMDKDRFVNENTWQLVLWYFK